MATNPAISNWSYISKEARICGKVDFGPVATIKGKVEGEIVGDEIVIAPSAVVVARITANKLKIGGQVDGEIIARERIELLPTARLRCTITTPRLVVAEGAQFDGDCNMPRGLASSPQSHDARETGVSFFITQAQRAELRERGYSDDDIVHTKPAAEWPTSPGPRRIRAGVLFVLALLASIIVVALISEPQAVLVIASAVLLIWSVRQTLTDPYWLIFALVLEEVVPYLNLLPFDPDSRWWIRYPLLVSLCVPAIRATWKSGILRHGYFAGYLVYFGWAAISITYSKVPTVSAGRLLPAIVLFAALSRVASEVSSAEDVEKLLQRYLMACAVLVVLNIVAALAFRDNVLIEGVSPVSGIYSWQEGPVPRFSGFMGEPNAIGGLMFSSVCAGLAYWHATRGWSRRLVLMLMASSLMLGIMADSRTSFTGVAVGVATLTIWKYGFRGVAACMATVILLAAIYAGVKTQAQLYVTRDISTLTARTTLWQFEARKLAESPLIGYGYDAEGAIFEDRYFPDWALTFQRGSLIPLHNGYMTVAIGTGVPSLALWFLLLMAPWVALFRGEDDPWCLKPLFFLVVVSSLVRALAESGIAEPRLPEGLLLFLSWMIAERYRAVSRAAEVSRFAVCTATGINWQRLFAS